MKQQAITQQDMDNATQNNVAAKAQVQASKAQIETARAQIQAANAAVQCGDGNRGTAKLNLSFTRLTSRSKVWPAWRNNTGRRTGDPASGPVTTVSTVDPIKVYFTASEQEYLDFHRRYSTPPHWNAARKGLRLELILSRWHGFTLPSPAPTLFADQK